MGYSVVNVNVGNFRRKILGPYQSPDFFDPKNAEAASIRSELARFALDEMMKQLKEGADIAIFDATNSTKDVRVCMCVCVSCLEFLMCVRACACACVCDGKHCVLSSVVDGFERSWMPTPQCSASSTST